MNRPFSNKHIFSLITGILLSLQVGNIMADNGRYTDRTSKLDSIVLGMGCFWGAEKRMSALPGVVDVESGYANGEIEGDYREILAHESRLRLGLSSKRNHADDWFTGFVRKNAIVRYGRNLNRARLSSSTPS